MSEKKSTTGQKNISHALVRFIKDDEIKIIEISNIREFVNKNPKQTNDFVEKKLYSGKKSSDDKYASIEIFAIGCKYLFTIALNYLIHIFFNVYK